MNESIAPPPRLALTFLLTALGMFLFELAKQGLNPQISIWQSHAVTILFASLIGTVVEFFTSRKATELHRRVLEQLTEREKAETLARQREENLSITLQSIGDAVIATDAAGRITRLNPVAETLTGWRADQALNRPVEEVFQIRSEATGELVENPVARVLREGAVVGLANHTELLARDGARRPIADSGAPIRDRDGGIVGVVLVFRDQTQERAALSAISHSESLLRAVVETTPNVAIQGYNPEGRVLFWNKASEVMFGFSAAEAVGKTLDQTIHTPEEAAGFLQVLKQIEATGKAIGPTEYGFRRRNGTAGTCLSTTFRVPAPGQGSVFICMDVDLTERKQAEEARRRLTAVLESTSDLVGTSDPEGRVQYVNRAGLVMIGRPPDLEISHLNIQDFHPPWAAELIFREGIPTAREHGIWRGETALRTAEGREYPVSQVILAHKDEKGALQYFSTIIRDISELKRAEQFLRESESQLRKSQASIQALVNALPEPAFLLDRNKKFVSVNRALLRSLNRKLEDVAGRSAQDFSLPAITRTGLERVDAVLLSKQPEIFEDARHGSYFRNYVYPAMDEEGQVFGAAVFSLDITERKHAEEQLIEYQRQLQQLAARLVSVEEQERRKFSQLLHDQIGQNLTFARVRLGVLRNKVADPEIKAALSDVLAVIVQMSQETRSLTYELSPPILYEIGLNPALEWLGEHFQTRYHLNCRMEGSDTPDALDPEVRVALFQTVRELLFNVLKHARASQVTIQSRITPDLVTLAVQDDGQGFEPGAIIRTDTQDGGFGLFSVRERMRAVKGRMQIESAPGKGTCVRLEIPVGQEMTTEAP